MELRRLRYFVTLAEMLHFRRAAERLHIAQPTLSHQMRLLEKEMGASLFERVGRRVHLTPAGRIFKEHAQRAIKEVEVAATEISGLDGLLHGNLAVGVFQSFNSYMLPPLLREFHARYPDIRLAIHQLPKRDMEQRILNGELDLGIAYVPTISNKIEADELFEESYALIVGRRHALYGRTKLQVSALSKYPLILLTPEFPLRPVLDEWFARTDTKPRIIMEMNSNEAILETVRTSELATILASRRPRSMRGLHCIPLEPAITRTAAIFWRRGGHKRRSAVVIADMIKEAYGANAGEGQTGTVP